MLQQLIDNKDVTTLCEVLFKFTPSPMQAEIIRKIAYGETRKLVICAYTRYGKSKAVAAAAALYLLFHRKSPVNLIAPIEDQTKIIRGYISEFITTCQPLADMVDLDASGIDRLKKEVSKQVVTFKDDNRLKVFSADGEGSRMMGWGGRLVICDEAADIKKEVHEAKITRMLGDFPEDSILVLIGNPLNRDNQFYDAWINPTWDKIHVPWQVGLAEGRTTQAFIDEQREILKNNPMMFKILYDALFPEESEDQLIKLSDFNTALERQMRIASVKQKSGLDVAEHGMDETVLFNGITDGRNFKIESAFSWGHKNPMETVGLVSKKAHPNAEIVVDTTGVGSGVTPRLKELGFNSVEFKGGASPETQADKDTYYKKKDLAYWQLRLAFQEGRIDISALKKFPDILRNLSSQLMKIKYEIRSDRLISIIKPEDKSPDYADALSYFVTDCGKRKIGIAAVDMGTSDKPNKEDFEEIRGFGPDMNKIPVA
jgi:hypothetical protein